MRQYRLGAILFICFITLGTSISCRANYQEIHPIKVMEREQAAFDELPSELGSNLDLGTVRLLDRRNSRSYWAAYNADGDLCVILGFNIGRPDWSAGLSCDKDQKFDSQGLAVVVKGGNHFSSAIFVPDGYTLNLIDAFPGQYIGENLVAFDSLAGLQSAVGDQTSIKVASVNGNKPDIELSVLR